MQVLLMKVSHSSIPVPPQETLSQSFLPQQVNARLLKEKADKEPCSVKYVLFSLESLIFTLILLKFHVKVA